MMIFPRTTFSAEVEEGINLLLSNDATKHLASKHTKLLEISHVVAKKMSAMKSQFKSPFAFSRIIERSSESGRFLFGSKMKIRKYKEFQMLAAKFVDGEWVPDNDKMIVTFAITDEMLSSAMIDATASNGYPVTISGILGGSVEQPDSVFVDTKEQYTATLIEKKRYLKEACEVLVSAVSEIQDPKTRISKEYKSRILDSLKMFRKNLSDDVDFDLSCLIEAMEKDSVSIYSDVLANINAILKGVSEDELLLLDNNQGSSVTSYVHDIADYFLGDVVYELVVDFVNDVRKVVAVKPKEKFSEGLSIGNKIDEMFNFYKHSGSRSNRGRKFESCNGLLRMSSSGCGRSNFFGDSKDLSRFVSFDVSWGHVADLSYGDIRYSEHISMLKFSMTPVQYLQLIQGSGTGMWVKTTLNRFSGYGTDTSQFEHVEHDKLRVPKLQEPDVSKKVAAIIDEISELLATNSQSKDKRIKLLELSKKLIVAVDMLESEREDIFYEEGEKLKNMVIKNQMLDIAQVFEVISSKRPDVKDKITGILSSEVYKLEKKD